MEPVSEKALAEFKKCITYVCTEPDDEKVLEGLRYILSLPDRSAGVAMPEKTIEDIDETLK